ncbi:MAG TPA: hypothetical protein VFG30_00505 [Polyangiales bacterium]|nr:hypothetical protein [Polyangiales bacterium]
MSSDDKKSFADFLVDALDDDVDEAEQKDAVRSLGINVSQLAARLRQQVADHDAAERKQRWARAARERDNELRRLAAEPADEQLSLPELFQVAQRLLEQAGPSAGMHYMKFETAKEEDLRQAIRALRHLLKERDGKR